MRTLILIATICSIFSTNAMAQFTGPSAVGQQSTVKQATQVQLGTYVTLSGSVVEHLRGDYFTFRDTTGTIRVEIPGDVWHGVSVSPTNTVRIVGEVDQNLVGRYVYIKSLELLK
jgi:Uncharacterized conserved protein